MKSPVLTDRSLSSESDKVPVKPKKSKMIRFETDCKDITSPQKHKMKNWDKVLELGANPDPEVYISVLEGLDKTMPLPEIKPIYIDNATF